MSARPRAGRLARRRFAAGPPGRFATLPLATLSFVALLLAAGCGRDAGVEGQTGGAPPVQESEPRQRIGDLNILETQLGIARWRLLADSARTEDAAHEVRAEGVRVSFYDKPGKKVVSVLTSVRGRLDERTRNMTAIRNVVVINQDDGTRLDTDSLTFFSDKNVIRCEGPVRVTKGKDVMTGIGLVADPDLARVEILQDMRAWVVDEQGRLREDTGG